MNSSAYRFTLDLHSTQSQISLPVTLGDTARELYISFSDGGQPYIIPDGFKAKIIIKRPTGTRIVVYCAIESNTTIKYEFENNPRTAVVEGIHNCTITLYDAHDKEIASPRFTMVVSDKVANFDDITPSEEELDLIEDMIQQEIDRQGAEDKRKAAEIEREATHTELREMMERLKELGLTATSRISVVSLPALAWEATVVDGVEGDPYYQVAEIEGVTKYTKVDLLPSVEQLAIFHDKDLAFVTENEEGVVTVYAIGDKPKNDYTMQVALTEVLK